MLTTHVIRYDYHVGFVLVWGRVSYVNVISSGGMETGQVYIESFALQRASRMGLTVYWLVRFLRQAIFGADPAQSAS